MKPRKAKGFTLIELMIVVAIIGILAAIAIPKFAELIRKSKEGATKGNLGALRSALTIYYSENEMFPDTAANVTTYLKTKYIEAIPTADVGTTAYHGKSAAINAAGTDDGAWGYVRSADGNSGIMQVNCSHTDTKSTTISIW